MKVTKGAIVRDVVDKVRFENGKRERQRSLFPEFDSWAMSTKRAHEIVTTLFDIMMGALEQGEDVSVAGFGAFRVQFRWARRGRHPVTGEPLILKSRRVVTFRAFGRLRKRINV